MPLSDAEITRALAEEVMGWAECTMPRGTKAWSTDGAGGEWDGGGWLPQSTWRPLESIADAWVVRDRLASVGRVTVANGYGVFEGCEFDPFTGGPPLYRFLAARATATTAPQAICYAALRAVGVEPEG